MIKVEHPGNYLLSIYFFSTVENIRSTNRDQEKGIANRRFIARNVERTVGRV